MPAAPSVFVLDYAMARPRRLMHALAAVDVDAKLTETPLSAKNADILIVPDGDDEDAALAKGVSTSTFDVIAAHVDAGRPLLSIGLGLCFLLSGRVHPALPPSLDVFRAPVQRFDVRMTDELERPLLVPHNGPSLVVGLDRHPALSSTVPKGEKGVWLQFRHRLCAPSRVPQADVEVCHHGVPFAGAIWRGQVLAIQFLPEHSGKAGLDVLRAFHKAASASVERAEKERQKGRTGTPGAPA